MTVLLDDIESNVQDLLSDVIHRTLSDPGVIDYILLGGGKTFSKSPRDYFNFSFNIRG